MNFCKFGMACLMMAVCVQPGFASSRSAMYSYDNGGETNISIKTTKTRTYSNPYANRDMNSYSYRNGGYTNRTTTNRSGVYKTHTDSYRTTEKRKFFLANPFYQPLQGVFGSVTGLEIANSSYKMLFDAPTPLIYANGEGGFGPIVFDGIKGKWKSDIFSVKEDISFGITDRLALQIMGRYDSSKYKFTWSQGFDDEMKDSGLNMFGIGLQGRIVDEDNFIAMISGYYEHQKDISNDLLFEAKAGYKVSRTTLYGLVRGWWLNLENDFYGNAVSDGTESFLFAYDTDVDSVFDFEGGLGLFSVLSEDWTFNLEAVFGNYDWHNQASARAELGFQPNDWFALTVYARTSLYDSADGKKIKGYYYNPAAYVDNGIGGYDAVTGYAPFGDVKLSDYKEWNAGVRVMFKF
ncbi:MAG: hypothetical protein ACLRFI_01360 [Alphaproteobacteria bacterium]